MQRLKQEKRGAILAAAARLFGARPFHKVRLEDVAAAAGVGKGTVYIYVKSKEELYSTLIYDGFTTLVNQLKEELKGHRVTPRQGLRRILEALVNFALEHPDLFAAVNPLGGSLGRKQWQAKRQELASLIVRMIRRGIRRGEMRDPNPELSALCITGLVRSVFLFGSKGKNPRRVIDQLVHFIERGVGVRNSS